MISAKNISWYSLLFALGVAIVAMMSTYVRAEGGNVAVVSALRVGADSETTRVVIDLDRPVAFSTFTLADPYRVVIDLPEVGWRLPPEPLPEQVGLLQRLRYGLFSKGTSRVVLDASGPVEVTKSFILPPATSPDGKTYRLVVDLKETSLDAFLVALQAHRESVVATTAVAPPPTVATPPVSTAPVSPRPKPSAVVVLSPPPVSSGTTQAPVLPKRKPAAPRRFVIAIDAGHGGVDPGTLGARGTREKNVTLALARALAKTLSATGRYKVVLTRNSDVFLRLRQRVSIARKAKADLFISIHADAIKNRKIRGMSVYTLSERASDKEAQMLADKENKADLIAGIDLSGETQEVTDILIDLAQRESMNQSSIFANGLVGSIRKDVKLLRNTHRFAGFAVLKAPDIPSVLIEAGFLSNRDDEKLLLSSKHRARMARAITRGIDQYFSSIQEAALY